MGANAVANPFMAQLTDGNRVLALPPPETDVEAEVRLAKPYEMMHTREKKHAKKRNKRSAEKELEPKVSL